MTFSTLRVDVDPSKLVDGITRDQVEGDPVIFEFFKANFPDAFDEPTEEIEPQIITEKEGEDEEEYILPESSVYVKREVIKYPRNIRPLRTYTRNPYVDGAKLRKWEQMIPGILYGGDPTLGIFGHKESSKTWVKTPTPTLQSELDRYGHHLGSRVYDLTLCVDGTEEVISTHRVMPRNVQRHPVNASMLYCVNFCRYHARRPIQIPVEYINEEESPALKREGYVIPIKRYIECFVDDDVPIPETLEIECTGLLMKNVVRLDRVLLPEGVRFSDRVLKRGKEFIIGVVFGKTLDPVDTEETTEEKT